MIQVQKICDMNAESRCAVNVSCIVIEEIEVFGEIFKICLKANKGYR